MAVSKPRSSSKEARRRAGKGRATQALESSVAKPERSAAGRRIFVGDVQGCADELEELIAAVEFRPERDELWFVGDLVNRGPRSLDALRCAHELATGVVLGNHDLHLLGIAAGLRKPRRGDTLQEILHAPDRDELLTWLRSQPLLKTWDDLRLVHAGLNPRWSKPEKVAARLERSIARGEIPFADPDLQFLTNVRTCSANGERPKDDAASGKRYRAWDSFYKGRRRVVFGHWAARGLVCTKRVRGIDSGCVWGGELTAWIAEEDRFVSIPAHRVYRRPSARG